MARSLEVNRVTTFSMVTGSPSRTSSMRCWAIRPGSCTVRRFTDSVWPSRITRVRAAWAIRTVDVLVSAWSQMTSWPTSPASTGTRWRPLSAL